MGDVEHVQTTFDSGIALIMEQGPDRSWQNRMWLTRTCSTYVETLQEMYDHTLAVHALLWKLCASR